MLEMAKKAKWKLDEFCGLDEINTEGQIIYYGMIAFVLLPIVGGTVAKVIFGV